MSALKRGIGIDVLTAAQRRLSFVFDRFEKVCVSFSAGKDSTVLLHLAAAEAARRGRKIGLLLIDLEAQYRHTIEHALRCFDLYRDSIEPFWVSLPLSLRNAVSQFEPQWICFDPAREVVRRGVYGRANDERAANGCRRDPESVSGAHRMDDVAPRRRGEPRRQLIRSTSSRSSDAPRPALHADSRERRESSTHDPRRARGPSGVAFMIDFEPSEEQALIIETVHQFAENEIRPRGREADESGVLPSALLAAAHELGLVANGARAVFVGRAGIGVRARPVPLPSRISEEERIAHAAFIATLGEAAVWKSYALAHK